VGGPPDSLNTMIQNKPSKHDSIIRVVSAHWGLSAGASPKELISNALRKEGEDPARLSFGNAALGRIDEFHCLGVEATDDLAALIGLQAHSGARVLDVGCGLGGPARRLASKYGCDVVCLDITEQFLEVAREVSDVMGLTGRISFLNQDACTYSSRGELFDIAWMQVAAANIEERFVLYQNINRALRPGGRLGIFDIFQTPDIEVKYPVPWSDDGSGSALMSEAETVATLSAAGFRCTAQVDVSARAIAWFDSQYHEADLEIRGLRPPRVGFSLLLPRWREMASNQATNLRTGALRFGYIGAEKV